MSSVYSKRMLLSLSFLSSVLCVSAEDYTIVFKSQNPEDTSVNNAIRQTTRIKDVVKDGVDFISGFTANCANSFYDKPYGVRIGKAYESGTFEFSLSDICSHNIASIRIKSAKHANDSGQFSFGFDENELIAETYPNKDYSLDFDDLISCQTLYFKSAANRFYISEITIKTIDVQSVHDLTFVAENSSGHWATYSSDTDTFFPNSVAIYTVSVADSKLVLTQLPTHNLKVDNTFIEGTFVPRQCGVLLSCPDQQATYYEVSSCNYKSDLYANNYLFPGTGALITAPADCKYYKLAYDDYEQKTGLGFYWGEDNGKAFVSKIGGAYLAIPNDFALARGFDFDDLESIEDIYNNNSTIDGFYTTAGVFAGCSFENLASGIYISNGKIIIKK